MNQSKNDSAVAHYVTFGCFQRKHLFLNEPLSELFVAALDHWRKDEGIDLFSWVIMANHVHLLVFKQDNLLVKSLAKLKQGFSFRALQWLKVNRPAVYRNLEVVDHKRVVHRFWQAGGGYDRGVYSNDALKKAVDYIHRNPVRAGLTDTPDQYKWSSAKAWVSGKADPIGVDVPDWWWRVYK